jgi:hypothetical protein
MSSVRLTHGASHLAAGFLILALTTVFTIAQVPQNKPQTQTGPGSVTRKKAPEKRTDFSSLASLKDTLIDLKAAIEVGINREDYSHKLQSIAAESLKADERLKENKASTAQLRDRLICYQHVLSDYKFAAIEWNDLTDAKRPTYDDLPGINKQRSDAEDKLQQAWANAAGDFDGCSANLSSSR